jgi:glycosyltransferase involved in cell wall biosynthesis
MLSWRRKTAQAGRVSVVVPLYNHGRYIGEAIASILAEGKLVREIIVIDDGSSDDSIAVMEKLARQDSRIVFRAQANQGAHATINAGLQSCSGELLTILNSDDAYLPGRLAALVTALEAEPEAAIAASALAFMNDASEAIENLWYQDLMAGRSASQDMGVALINGNFLMTTSNLLFRRSLIEELGLFAPLRYAHDLDFALRCLTYGKRILVVDQRLLRYRIHATNTISENHSKVRAEWAMCAAAYFANGLDSPSPDRMDWETAASLEDVLRRHELGKAVHLCMSYLRRWGMEPLDRNRLLSDQEFLNRLSDWV